MQIPIDLNSLDIPSFLMGATIGGLGVGGLALFRYRKSQSQMGSGNIVDQSKSKAEGDIVGRDKQLK